MNTFLLEWIHSPEADAFKSIISDYSTLADRVSFLDREIRERQMLCSENTMRTPNRLLENEYKEISNTNNDNFDYDKMHRSVSDSDLITHKQSLIEEMNTLYGDIEPIGTQIVLSKKSRKELPNCSLGYCLSGFMNENSPVVAYFIDINSEDFSIVEPTLELLARPSNFFLTDWIMKFYTSRPGYKVIIQRVCNSSFKFQEYIDEVRYENSFRKAGELVFKFMKTVLDFHHEYQLDDLIIHPEMFTVELDYMVHPFYKMYTLERWEIDEHIRGFISDDTTRDAKSDVYGFASFVLSFYSGSLTSYSEGMSFLLMYLLIIQLFNLSQLFGRILSLKTKSVHLQICAVFLTKRGLTWKR
eukprot:TRINITY_DN4151_c0_g1_i2.p1 TRINITY_DN4151_c0_g1~~TRINITY_DN4151_c0_g1_i2.p1  ORF type:complete len:365 (+),score=63.39 TRINITY_DN4151_c0_g1_i2:26-1096(+)